MNKIYRKVASLGCVSLMVLCGCQEQIDEGARYTFVGETVATHLQADPECSHFVEILTRGEVIGLMKAYGEYTCFAPTNDAVERFLLEQDSIYHASSAAGDTIDTGVYTPYLADLSAKKCAEIARNHILPIKLFKVELSGSELPENNMNRRKLTLGITDGSEGQEAGVPLINGNAKVLGEDVEVVNGVVFKVDEVINPSSKNVYTQLAEYSNFSLFAHAIEKTGYLDRIALEEDLTYNLGNVQGKGFRDQLAYYPETKLYKFTIFATPDDVFEKKGIFTSGDQTTSQKFAALEKYCQEKYPETMKVWDWDGNISDYVDHDADLTDWRNPVNQFVGYHILDREVSYPNLVCHNLIVNGNGLTYESDKDFRSDADRTEYYVTMNNRILKVTKPLSAKNGAEKSRIYLNYAPEGKGQNILVANPSNLSDERFSDFTPLAKNGAIQVIEDVLVYDEKIMKEQVLNCIIRFDASSLFSELTNNNVRLKIGRTATSQAETIIPHDYCKNFKSNSDVTRLLYLSPHHEWHNYQGDEMIAFGHFDFEYRLPPVPAGTYEIRMGYTTNNVRCRALVYLDGDVTGLPVDVTMGGSSPEIDWKYDNKSNNDYTATVEQLEGDAELIAANDKDMKNRGFLKAPSTMMGSTLANAPSAREVPIILRKVIATKHLTDGAHWLRFKSVDSKTNGEFMHDYFELVPLTYLNDESISEIEKRK